MAWDPLTSLKENAAFRLFWSFFSRSLTLAVVLLGWIFFRAESWGAATQYLSRLVSWSADGTRLISPYILPAIAAVVSLAHLLVRKDRLWALEIAFSPASGQGLCLLLTDLPLGLSGGHEFCAFYLLPVLRCRSRSWAIECYPDAAVGLHSHTGFQR